MNTLKKYKLDFRIYQIYYDQFSGSNLDNGFVPYNNTGVKTKGYENEIILDVWINKRNEWLNVDYVGVLSWRFFEKTKLKSQDLFKKVAENNEAVISIMPRGSYANNAHPFSRTGDNLRPILELCKLVDKAKLFDFKTFQYPVKRNIWCNYWITTPEIFDLYCCNYLNKVMTLFNTTKDKELLNCLNKTIKHRNKVEYSVVTFFLEGLFRVFLEEEKIKYFEIIA